MKKQILREIYLKKRMALTQDEKKNLEEKITVKFNNYLFKKSKNILLYHPIEEKKEPDVPQIISLFIQKNKCNIFFPLIDTSNFTMQVIAVNKKTTFIKNKWGINEPFPIILKDPKKIDMVIIPLLIFDLNGFRVGYGKGYYDRFLEKNKHIKYKVGIGFFEAVEKIEDFEKFDIPLTHCFTPYTIYEF